jgi:hypothetical protein
MPDLSADSPDDSLLDRTVRAATRAGLAGRRSAIVLEGRRFPAPGDPEGQEVAGGLLSAEAFGADSDALLLAAGPGLVRDPLLAVRSLADLGVRQVLLLADADPVGSVVPDAGMAVVRDHVNLRAANPLVGPNEPRFGPRFPDLSEAYDRALRQLLSGVAGLEEEGIVVGAVDEEDADAVLAHADFWSGLGIHALTAGIVPGAIVARHAGLRVAALVAYRTVHVDELRALVRAFPAND